MQKKGSVQAPYASKYPEFRYRKPLQTELNHRTIDPARLDPMHEYPRSTSMDKSHLRVVELADYKITMSGVDADNISTVRLTMLPNEYTEATEPRTVVEFKAAHVNMFFERYSEEAMKLAFG